MACLYRHIRTDKNEVFYVGIGLTADRAFSKEGRSDFWKRVIAKTSYEIEILFEDITWEEACLKEIEFIALYGRKPTGSLVNLTAGGEGFSASHSSLSKAKISESKKGIFKGGKAVTVLNTETGIFYESISEAARAHGYNRFSLWNMLSNRYKNNTSFINF
jgi:hypothetical protein